MQLADHVYLAHIGARAIALDLKADRYIGLGERLARTARSLLAEAGGPRGDDASADHDRSKLIGRGILVEGRSAPAAAAGVPAAVTHSLWPDRPRAIPATADWGRAAGVFRALAEVSWSLRFRPFLATVNGLRQARRRAGRGRCAAGGEELVNAFATARPWFPAEPICRLDAPALFLHLWRNRCPCELVFGVRLDPFAAHCWIQIDGAVVNEPFDSTRQYTPILVV